MTKRRRQRGHEFNVKIHVMRDPPTNRITKYGAVACIRATSRNAGNLGHVNSQYRLENRCGQGGADTIEQAVRDSLAALSGNLASRKTIARRQDVWFEDD